MRNTMAWVEVSNITKKNKKTVAQGFASGFSFGFSSYITSLYKKPKKLRNVGFFIVGLGVLSLSSCGSTGLNEYGVKTSERIYDNKGEIPQKIGYYKVGKPYKVAGKWYYPREDKNYNKTGKASWYGKEFHGRETANGEVFDMYELTAAHKTLPLPSLVKVTNLDNNKTIIVRVNDRGPYFNNRIIDLSRAASIELGFKNKGIGNVRVEYIGKAALDQDKDVQKIAALGGKVSGQSKAGRSFFDQLFGWNQPKFVAENTKPKTVKLTNKKAKSSQLKVTDMQEFDPEIGAAISSSGSVQLQKPALKLPNSTGEFIQVAMFKDIKQAIEYKKQLGSSVFSKIDIKHQDSIPVYLVMVQT